MADSDASLSDVNSSSAVSLDSGRESVCDSDASDVEGGVGYVRNEFDDDALEQARAECARHRNDLIQEVAAQSRHLYFDFVDVCEAQAAIDQDATASPFSEVPLPLVLVTSETCRTCWLFLCNLVYAWRCLPSSWSLVPIVPVSKPGKDRAIVEHNRQISLLNSLFKVYDVLLFHRRGRSLNRSLLPWQAGGNFGAEDAAWLLKTVLLER